MNNRIIIPGGDLPPGLSGREKHKLVRELDGVVRGRDLIPLVDLVMGMDRDLTKAEKRMEKLDNVIARCIELLIEKSLISKEDLAKMGIKITKPKEKANERDEGNQTRPGV